VWRDIEGYENVKVYEGNFNMDHVEKTTQVYKVSDEKA
jgi:hypothetical protein